MKTPRSALIRLASIAGLALVFLIAFSEAGDTYRGYFDLRAALLVFIAPIFVLMVFGRSTLPLRASLARIRRLRTHGSDAIAAELATHSAAARGQYGYSHVARFAESHADPMIRHAGSLYAARFEEAELSRLLARRIQAEDAEWQAGASAVAFLAKMAPYFGMLATVIGMIKLLQNMTDFTKISGSMALAMQGTLYGLLSFTVLYSPLQRYVAECREQWLQRNELILRWFTLLASQADPLYIERDLAASSTAGSDEVLTAMPKAGLAAGAPQATVRGNS